MRLITRSRRKTVAVPRSVVKHCLREDLELPALRHNWDDLSLLAYEREVTGCWKILWIGRIAFWWLREKWVVPGRPLLPARLECMFKVPHNFAVAARKDPHGGTMCRHVVQPHPIHMTLIR